MKVGIVLCVVILGYTTSGTSAQTMRVTLLGTGTPDVNSSRMGPATLVEAGSQKFLIDAGRGTTIRLSQTETSLDQITAILLTHFHSDHLNGLSDVWLTGYMAPVFRQDALRIIGPAGLTRLTSGLEAAFSLDREQRRAEYQDLGLHTFSERAARFNPTEITEDGVVFDEDGVQVSAFAVSHGRGPAYGYRVDWEGRSVVISCDTAPSDNLVLHSRGVDLLVHEVMALDEAQLREPLWQGIMRLHTSPHDAGVVFEAVHPKLAVYNHVGLGETVSVDRVLEKTHETYRGQVRVGEDLMTLEIDDTITVTTRE